MNEIPKNLHLIPHTHWDREWYVPFVVFQSHLVDMVDRLIDIMEKDPNYLHFLLDAQTVVLEDYLEIRPEREENLKKLISTKRVFVGPWYDQPDEWLGSGELLIRNLLIGHQIASKFGHVMKEGYIPDVFGHISQLPQILSGCGIHSAIFERGIHEIFDNPNYSNDFYWGSPDGSKVLAFVMDSYANAKNHPTDQDSFNSFILFTFGRLGKYKANTFFIGSGGDHYIAQPETPQFIEGFNANEEILEELDGGKLIFSNWPALLADERKKIEDYKLNLFTYTGELRGGRVNIFLPGTISSRMPIKTANVNSYTWLENYLEPVSVLSNSILFREVNKGLKEGNRAQNLVNPKQQGFLRKAWKLLLQNQPHDSICGCSDDKVHQDMEYRFRQVEEISRDLVKEALMSIADHFPVAPNQSRIPILVFNPCPWKRTVQFSFCAGSYHNESQENTIHVPNFEISDKDQQYRLVDYTGGIPNDKDHEDLSKVRVLKAQFCIRPYYRREPEKRWVLNIEAEIPDIPALGYKFIYLETFKNSKDLSSKGANLKEGFTTPQLDYSLSKNDEYLPITNIEEFKFENQFYTFNLNKNGTFKLKDKKSGITHDNLLTFEDDADVGDGYDWREIPGTAPILSTAQKTFKHSVSKKDILNGVKLRIQLEFSVPKGVEYGLKDDKKRSANLVPIPIITTITLLSGTDRIEFETTVDNIASDHRLRVLFPSGFQQIDKDTVHADSHFDVVDRNIKSNVPTANWAQRPEPTNHMVKFVTATTTIDQKLHSLSMFSKGLPEYEASYGNDGKLKMYLTLFRSFAFCGANLPRRGKAGPDILTPEAQLLREMKFSYAIKFHPDGWEKAQIKAEAHEFAHSCMVAGGFMIKPGTGKTTREYNVKYKDPQASSPSEVSICEINNKNVMLSALKLAEDKSGIILRCYNTTEINQSAQIRLHLDWKRVLVVNLLEEPIVSTEPLKMEINPENQHIQLSLTAKKIYSFKFIL